MSKIEEKIETSEEETRNKDVFKEKKVTKLSHQTWFTIVTLAIVGEIAWAIENTWFNVFVYDEITTDPTPIAWMVAISAITATLTTIFIGVLSDRTRLKMGRRKVFILFGYILWGVITAIFPMVELIQNISVAVVMVIFLDAVMTFFGSTAYDASFNAWITDTTDKTNRGRVQGIISMGALIANLIAIGASGFIIEAWGFSVFFYLMGGIVTITGLFVGMQIQESPISLEEQNQPKKRFMEDLILTFKPETVKKNPILYLLLLHMALVGIASQISGPFLFIYIENFLEFSKEEMSIVGGGVILIVAIASVVYGMYSHRFHRKKMLFTAIIIHSIFSIIFYFTRGMLPIFIVMIFSLSSGMINMIILNSWIQDLLPEQDRGKFQGIRMIFYVAIPMIFGPMIGSAVIKNYGIPTIDEFGTTGFIPTPEIFLFEGVIVLFALIPLFFIAKKHGEPVFAQK